MHRMTASSDRRRHASKTPIKSAKTISRPTLKRSYRRPGLETGSAGVACLFSRIESAASFVRSLDAHRSKSRRDVDRA